MEKEEIKEQLTLIFREVFTDETIVLQDEMTANDVERWDSMTHMIMISKVEESFGVSFKLRELNKLKQVSNLIDVLYSKLN